MVHTEPAWTAMPAVATAAATGDIGTLLRVARTATGLTLEEAGQLTGYSTATLSRMENGRRRHWTIAELRRLAEVYGIPPHLLGLATTSPPTPPDAAKVSQSPPDGDGGDWMRRRDLIAGTVGLTVAATLSPTHASGHTVTTLDEVIFGRLQATPLSPQQLTAQLAAAQADFRACRYNQLARRLPALVAHAAASRDHAPTDQVALASARLSQAYCIATRLLLKLHDDGMAWSTSDRALQAAHASADPMITAEASRVAATVLRRSNRDSAQRLVLHAAQRLNADTGLTDTRQTSMYGQLLAVAAYTAAIRDDRDSAWTLLGEADDAARRAGTDANRFNTLDLAVYKISVARVLGDYGTAVDHARQVDPTQITAPERRARYWEDTALALHGRGRPTAAYHALLTAERDTPQEVRYRPWARNLTRDLLHTDTRSTLPGIRDLANRIGVTT